MARQYEHPLRYRTTVTAELCSTLERNRIDLEEFLNNWLVRIDPDVARSVNDAPVWDGANWTPAAVALGGHNHDTAYISIIAAPAANHFPYQTAGGELIDSAFDAADFATAAHNHDAAYISIVAAATAGNFPTLTAGGELANSVYGPTSFLGATATGNYLAAGTVTATALAYSLTTALADIGIVCEPAITSGADVIVLVWAIATAESLATGDWWRLQITVEGAAKGIYMEADTSTAGGTGNTGASSAANTGASSAASTGGSSAANSGYESAHTHSAGGASINNISGPASAGTAHTHTSGTYNWSVLTTGAGSQHRHTISHTHTITHTHTIAHTHAGPSHTHSQASNTITTFWVGAVTEGGDGKITIGLQARGQTAAGAINRAQISYLILRG